MFVSLCIEVYQEVLYSLNGIHGVFPLQLLRLHFLLRHDAEEVMMTSPEAVNGQETQEAPFG